MNRMTAMVSSMIVSPTEWHRNEGARRRFRRR
jgi:hypothetical protein